MILKEFAELGKETLEFIDLVTAKIKEEPCSLANVTNGLILKALRVIVIQNTGIMVKLERMSIGEEKAEVTT